jgi:ATP-dependent DNA helicase RecG
MALPVNIEDLLNKRKVEGNRIEFKKGWNPISIYHSICAFANDIDNIGGGYILVGVDEVDGIALRPVEGVQLEKLDHIQKELQRYNQLFEPYYAAKIFVEEIDDKYVIVLWAPSGNRRPYSIPADVTAQVKRPVIYIRYGSTSIEAKGEVLDELRMMAVREPFDERGNPDIKLEDISMVLLRDYLVKVGSKLSTELWTRPLPEILDQMNLYTGSVEQRWLKNVSAMMFCETPEKFFPYTQVDIVVFPEGKVKNPHNFTEKTFKGSVPQMIKQTLDYLSTNIVYEVVQKVSGKQEANRFWNYPYDALEEAVVNSLYHRSYDQHEPVEITIEPDGISILNCPGPDRSILMSAIEKGDILKSRRYRNRYLGDFLKELELTEGRSTGVPTIQEKLAANGSPRATFETTDDRLTFLIHIPIHAGCENNLLALVNKNQSIGSENTENSSEMGSEKDAKGSELSSEKSRAGSDKPHNVVQSILDAIRQNSKVSAAEIAMKLGMSSRAVEKRIKTMRENGIIRRVGPDRGGYWEII